MVVVQAVWHFSFTVSDLGRSVEFYRDLLGMELVAEQRQANEYTRRLVGYADADLAVAQLRVPGAEPGVSGHHLELIQYHAPRSQLPTPTRNTVGAAHLAFVTGDLDGAHRSLIERGVVFVSPPNEITEGVNRGGKTCYFLDPDGITLELVQPPASSKGV